jgi:hypothetical protein
MFGEHVCVVYQHFRDGELLLTRTKLLNGKFEVITSKVLRFNVTEYLTVTDDLD